MMQVTQPFLPPIEEYVAYLEGIWKRNHLTNHGPLVNELEAKLTEYLGVKHVFYVNNGTIALQIAIQAAGLKGKVITTPFSYVATVSSLVWEHCEPVFVDIKSTDFTIDPSKIEAKITPDTSAILATHVYGFPCDVEAIEQIAQKFQLKVIYDAAHAFGVTNKGTGILNWGDISTLSFHATKLFHTVEGGAIVTNDDELAHRISYMRNFGHNGQEAFWGVGINGKSSEFHAAMGLVNFNYLNDILAKREHCYELYKTTLGPLNIMPWSVPAAVKWNFAYIPVLLPSEKALLAVRDALNALYIYPRRYFYPSLSHLPYLSQIEMPIADSVACRMLSLPLYHTIEDQQIQLICKTIAQVLKHGKW